MQNPKTECVLCTLQGKCPTDLEGVEHEHGENEKNSMNDLKNQANTKQPEP